MIPDEAVEAGANIPGAAILAAESAVFDAMIEHGPDGHTDGHDKIARAALEAAAPIIRAMALEAAAPHMLAQAWEEGRLVGRAEEQSGFDTEMNPYEDPYK